MGSFFTLVLILRNRGLIMYWDRFDIAEAWYLALCHCHGGQRSREYSRLCKLSRKFRPSPFLDVETLTENGREIYDAACAKMLQRHTH